MPPSSSPPNYQTASAQASAFDLVLSSAQSASLTLSDPDFQSSQDFSFQFELHFAQAAPAIPDDGSASAPSGTAPRPSLMDGYSLRPPWKVAGVDYAVGFPSGQSLKDPTTDSAITSNPSITVDVRGANRTIEVNGNNVTFDGYDFTLHGGYTLSVATGNNTIVKNSKVGTIISASGTSNLTVTECILDGTGTSGQWPLVSHSGSGTLTLTYNWMRNYTAQAVAAGGRRRQHYI